MSNNLTLALQSMPPKFTSIEFKKQCKKMGMQAEELSSHVILSHLSSSCNRLSQRTWEKKEAVNNTLFPEFEYTEEGSIAFLKGLGCYEITKIVKVQM